MTPADQLRADLRAHASKTLRSIATAPNPQHSESQFHAAVDAIALLLEAEGADDVLIERAVALCDQNVPAKERVRAASILLALADGEDDDTDETETP